MKKLPLSPGPWRWYDHLSAFVLGCLAVLSVLGFLWSWTSSERYLQPQSIAFIEEDDGWDAVFVRYASNGSVTAEWIAEITVPATGRECRADGLASYDPVPENPVLGLPRGQVVYDVASPLSECLDADRPIILRQEWRVLLWGVFPLRPVKWTVTLE